MNNESRVTAGGGMPPERLENFVASVRENMDDADYGIYHDGNDHSRGSLWNCPRCVTGELLSALDAARDERDQAHKVVSAYYDDHVIEDDPPCPCSVCEKARTLFQEVLARAALSASPTETGDEG